MSLADRAAHACPSRWRHARGSRDVRGPVQRLSARVHAAWIPALVEVRMSRLSAKGGLRLIVADDGVGIPKDMCAGPTPARSADACLTGLDRRAGRHAATGTWRGRIRDYNRHVPASASDINLIRTGQICLGIATKWLRAPRRNLQDGWYVNLGHRHPDAGVELHPRRDRGDAAIGKRDARHGPLPHRRR